ncbi:hypothetical protein [Legionella sp. CNM-4043-24]|uniref:hypothetical protein n=1 Tax=Legionella sp. CNM-4043-24 TaxID=3421646 RepID=UPI00403A94EA
MKAPIIDYIQPSDLSDFLKDNASFELASDGYDIAAFQQDNAIICHWFEQLRLLFEGWLTERGQTMDLSVLAMTGSRSFGMSYTESDLECAIVSDNFDDFLLFAAFLNDRYVKTHVFEAKKTQAGLPLLTIRKRSSHFQCPLLDTLYPDNALPKLEVTFRHPSVHQTIQQAGACFFEKLPEDAKKNYVYNKRYISQSLKKAQESSDASSRQSLLELRDNLMQAIMIFRQGALQETPDFNQHVLRQAIELQAGNQTAYGDQIPETIGRESDILISGYLSKNNPDNEQSYLFSLLKQRHRMTPDDWALGQECFERDTPFFNFFKMHRDSLSSQLKIAGQYLTAVPIITFNHRGELYVLLMENPGLYRSSDVNETEWTAHGTRVDSREESLLQNKDLWDLFQHISRGDSVQTILLAAVYRRVTGMGINVNPEHLKSIHPIDRKTAGFEEENPFYQTSYFHLHLGDRQPEQIIHSCQAPSSSRYGKWTECFKVSDLVSAVKETPHKTKKRESYQLEHRGKQLTVRITSMRFILALSCMTDIAKDDDIQSPWDIGGLSTLERSLTWIKNREDARVQNTLFSEKTNIVSSARIHAYANKAGMNEENLALLTLKRERIVLHHVLAQLTIKTQIQDKDELKTFSDRLMEQYQKAFADSCGQYNAQYENTHAQYWQIATQHPLDRDLPLDNSLSPAELVAWGEMHALYEKLSKNVLSDRHKAIYHLTESDQSIAVAIAACQCWHQSTSSAISQEVARLIDHDLADGKLKALESCALDQQYFFGVTGPVASGKSVSEGLAKILLKGRPAAFISSDEWNDILVACLDLQHYSKQRGPLSLAEAWFIKNLIWDLTETMAASGRGVHGIQEAMNPVSLRIPPSAISTVFINTAKPDQAVDRVKARGERTGRYVSGSSTFSSYRWPWHQILQVLNTGMSKRSNLDIRIIDTDISHSFGSDAACIATLRNQVLNILNPDAFIAMVNRGYMINPAPQNAGDGWLMTTPDTDRLQTELEKLFDDQYQLTIQINGQNISHAELCPNSFTNNNNKGVKTMSEFTTWVHRLSLENTAYLSYYGHQDLSAEARSALSITGRDEFYAIRQSLYQLAIVLQKDSVDDMKAALFQSNNAAEDGFVFPAIADTAGLSQNLTALSKIRDEARSKYGKEHADELLIKTFLLHDLGKMKAFIAIFRLAPLETVSAASGDLYLYHWMKSHPELQAFFKEFANWVDVFDGLGYNPQKLSEAGYVGLLTIINQHLDKLQQLNQSNPDYRGNNVEVYNAYLFQKAKAAQLPLSDFSFLIDEATRRTPWSSLLDEQKNYLVMLIWYCPLIFVKELKDGERVLVDPIQVREQFISEWLSGKHQKITAELTDFMINNMESDDFLFLFNITGLIHHTAAQGGSHFATPLSTEELFTRLFPFVLDVVKHNRHDVLVQAASERGLNKFQALQAVELPASMFSLLLQGTKPTWRAIDFSSPDCKASYQRYVSQLQSTADSSCSSSSSYPMFFSAARSIPDMSVPVPVEDDKRPALL